MTSKPTSSKWAKQWCQCIIQPLKHCQSKCIGCPWPLPLLFEEGKRNCCGPLSTTLRIFMSITLVCWRKEGFEAQHQLLVARVVVLPDNELMPVRMANLTPIPITLYQGMRIGDFCPLASTGKACTREPATRRYLNPLKCYTLDRIHQVQMRLKVE